MKVEVKGKTIDKVKYFLEKSESLRDSDDKLIATMWLQEIGGSDNSLSLNAYQMLQKIAKGELTSTESIMRCRRKIQEKFEHLRGKNYEARQKNQEKIKKDLKK